MKANSGGLLFIDVVFAPISQTMALYSRITSRTRGSLSTTFVRGVAIADASLLVGLGDEER